MCVKQVPDSESAFRIDAHGKGYDEAGIVFRMNSYDAYAVEEAVRIKEERPQVEITALTVGPRRAEAVVRRALELGADHGVHLVTDRGQGMDPLEIASRIASYAKGRDFALMFFGVMSEDEQCSQTGPLVAALLDLPCATTVVSERILGDGALVRVEREREGGGRQVVELSLPSVLTVQSGINRPRYPSLSNKLRARKQNLEEILSIGGQAACRCQELVRVCVPPPSETGVFLEGSLEEKARALVRIIHEKTDVL